MQKSNVLNDLYKDWAVNAGVFHFLDSFNVPWKEVVTSDVLDLDYHGNRSGKKYISPLVANLLDEVTGLSDDKKDLLAKLIYQKFGTNWLKEWATLSFDYNPINNYDMDETEATHATASTNNDVYGFNSVSPSNDTDQSTQGDSTRTLNRHGNIGVMSSQDLVTQERELWLWKFFDVVFADVDSILTVPVFGCSSDKYYPGQYILPVASDVRLGGVKASQKTPDMTESVGIDADGKLWIAAGGNVESVNGKTGAVVLNYDDVGSPSLDEFQQIEEDTEDNTTAINQLWQRAEDIGQELDTKYSADNVPPYPVTSVNGMTGDVTVEGGGGGVDYSTSEQDTGTKWIDGSTVYQRTFTGNTGGTYGGTVASLPANYRIIDFSLVVTTANNDYFPYYESGTHYIRFDHQNSGTLNIWQYGHNVSPFRLTVKYIKT